MNSRAPEGCCRPAVRTNQTRHPTRAILVALIVALSGLGLLAVIPAHAEAMTVAPTPVTSMVQSGPQLLKDPFTISQGTARGGAANLSVGPAVTGDQPLAFTIGFQMRNSNLLQQVINDQSIPGSPDFQKWLSLADEESAFGADPTAMQDTINYFSSLGLHVLTRGVLSVSFTGTPSQVDQAFHTTIDTAVRTDGTTGIVNNQPLALPTPIATQVASVSGLNTALLYHNAQSFSPELQSELQAAPSDAPTFSAAPTTVPITNISAAYNITNAAYIWFQYYSHLRGHEVNWQVLTPASLNFLYNADPLLAQGYAGNSTGKPITIGILMAGDINPDDLQAYAQMTWNNPNQILNRLNVVTVDRAFGLNATQFYTDGASGELALDIEWSSTMAPAAHIEPIYFPSVGGFLLNNFIDDGYAAIENLATVPSILSNSWGGDEAAGNLGGPNWVNDQTLSNYISLLTARGVTVLASTGDGGGFNKGTGILGGFTPATNPNVLGVDGLRTTAVDPNGVEFPTNVTYGTTNMSLVGFTPSIFTSLPFYITKAGSLHTQSYWYEMSTSKNGTNLPIAPPSGSGGFGISYWYNQSWWQHAPGVPNVGRSLGSGVAAEADYNQSIYFDGAWDYGYGGTSFACPTTAGMFADILDYVYHNDPSAFPNGPYLGNGNGVVWRVANAWMNGNLTLNPFYDVTNGTSVWGNIGVENQWSYPAGQNFPRAPDGQPTYGNTTPGYNFPTGWGSINVANFAKDLLYLLELPASFMSVNAASTAYAPSSWANFALNETYTIHVNASSAIALTSPNVTVKFEPLSGPVQSYRPTLVPTSIPSSGFDFTLDTTTGVFTQPGLVVFEFGNGHTPTLGFGYSWIAANVPRSGSLQVKVIQPTTASMVSGYPAFSAALQFFFQPVGAALDPDCCTAYPNTFTVQVTYNGNPVYNAQVTSQIADQSAIAWQGSRAQAFTESFGQPHQLTLNTMSFSFTNLSGDAIVDTWNLVHPVLVYVNASYGNAVGGTTYTVTPGPNIKTTDSGGGRFSNDNVIQFLLEYYHQTVSNATINSWAPNAVNQSSYYNMLYGWQGEQLTINANDYAGRPLSNLNVWLGTLDGGRETKFNRWTGTGGSFGITNSSNTTAVTDVNGQATLTIPDNASLSNFLVTASGQAYAGLEMVNAYEPGAVNRTFQYNGPCTPNNLSNPKTTITCEYNNTLQRNYTSTALLILPNPISAYTMTSAKVERAFFAPGQAIDWHIDTQLLSNDPVYTGPGYNWDPGPMHIATAYAYIDGRLAGNLTPDIGLNWQSFVANGNLTGPFSAGVHDLHIVVTDTAGHVFTLDRSFFVGTVSIGNLPSTGSYTTLPYVMNWTLGLPAYQVNNHTFRQYLNIRYLNGSCGGLLTPCPTVVNLTEKIHKDQVNYNQSLNSTLMNLWHFYSGADDLPSGQYQIIIWLVANLSGTKINGTISTNVVTSMVFHPITAVINGPSAGAVIPVGNVTISYTYFGQYLTNATLLVYSKSDLVHPVFQAGAFVPGFGTRGGSATWTSTSPGDYEIVLAIGTPYNRNNTTEWVTVSGAGSLAYENSTPSHPLLGPSAAMTGAILAVVAGVVGLLIGMLVAPSIRGSAKPAAPEADSKPWQDSSKAAAKPTCPICKETFETDHALSQHQKIVHGIEE